MLGMRVLPTACLASCIHLVSGLRGGVIGRTDGSLRSAFRPFANSPCGSFPSSERTTCSRCACTFGRVASKSAPQVVDEKEAATNSLLCEIEGEIQRHHELTRDDSRQAARLLICEKIWRHRRLTRRQFLTPMEFLTSSLGALRIFVLHF